MDRNAEVLIVEDSPTQALQLKYALEQNGYHISVAEDGHEALAYLSKYKPAVVISDIIMPNMTGYELCQKIKSDGRLKDIPVILLTQLSDPTDVIKGLECKADGFLTKPCDTEYLSSKIEFFLSNPILSEAKAKADLEVSFAGENHIITSDRRHILSLLLSTFENSVRQNSELLKTQLELEEQMAETERLLLNILPREIADRLKRDQTVIADRFDDVTVLFADIVGFTKLAARIPPTELVTLLNELFSAFDQLTERHGLEKIKTIGDKYMVAGGLPTPRANHAEAVAEMAICMQEEIAIFNEKNNRSFNMRIGINTGPVVAGVIGAKKFIYDLWGETVNIASRMETYGIEGRIQVTEATYERLKDEYLFEERGIIHLRNAEQMPTYILLERKTFRPH